MQIDVSDVQVLANPYLLYELDRAARDPIRLPIIDRGLFPDVVVREKFPLPEPSRVTDATDARRVRGFVVQQLEAAAEQGHTLQSRAQVIQEIRSLDVQPACPIDGDLMTVVEGAFPPVVEKTNLRDDQPAYQLRRLTQVGKLIRAEVQKRVSGKRHSADIAWRKLLDEALKGEAPSEDQVEKDARQEKTAALEELFASRISVLIGPAGTGKTTLLKVLCNEPRVQDSGVLLLAPTGKARVRLENQTGLKGAQTIAQFLLPLDRYYPPTQTYRLSDREKVDAYKTIVIDEASMLTEEQFAAVLDAVKGVERLVLVGDPRQLPPIGAGRPFLDIVRRLAPEKVESIFPRVSKGYAELTVRLRQKVERGASAEPRADLLLAEWFSGRPVDAGADEIWNQIQENKPSRYLRFLRWDTPDELQAKLLDVLVQELKLAGIQDTNGFEQSLGGTLYNTGVFFWSGKNGEPGACAKVEEWQILSPVRGMPYGVEATNRLIQATFRAKTKKFATQRGRKIPKPMGREEILYGDKVINTQNQRRYKVWPENGSLKYVANGEIGIVVGQFKTQNAGYSGLPWQLEVEFSSQPSFKYGYGEKDFAEETGQPKLELAYSLTVHKTQGSEFGLTFVILPNPCRLLSRELLYTALTRQRQRVVVLHQGDWHALKQYATDYHSEAAARLTNLLELPHPVELQDRFLEEGLIHKTRRGESVRSKSEVIIANLMYEKGVDYEYEARLVGTDGQLRYPDFTIEDAASGTTIYWEHLGMMRDPDYKRRWEAKLKWYETQEILPKQYGGGANGTLIWTQDDERGGIDSGEIERVIDRLFD